MQDYLKMLRPLQEHMIGRPLILELPDNFKYNHVISRNL